MSQVGLIDVEAANPSIATSFTSDSGTAIPISNNLEILGASGLTTSASGKTITIDFSTAVPVSKGGTGKSSVTSGALLVGDGTDPLVEISLSAGQLPIGQTSGPPIANTITGGTGISVTNGDGSIILTASGSVPLNFVTDSGTATSSLSTVNFVGNATQGISSSGVGNTVTFTIADATSAQKGVVELATNTETVTGTDVTRPVTCSGLETKLGNITLNGLIVGGGAGQQLKATSAMTNGMVAIGSTGATPVAATLTAGTGISITNAAGSITINSTGGGFTWNEETGTSANLTADNAYIANNAALVTFTLPASASIGDEFQVIVKGAGLAKIAQNAGQTIHFGSSDTTTGAGGSLTATSQWDSIELVCVTANTDFAVLDSVGSWTIV